MARKPNEKAIEVKKLYDTGKKLVEIAADPSLPEGAVRRWKSTYGWDSMQSKRSESKSNRRGCKGIIGNEDLIHEQQLFACTFHDC